MPRVLRALIFLPMLFGIFFTQQAAVDEKVATGGMLSEKREYLYLDCANSYYAPMLVKCGELSINRGLANVYVGEIFEEGLAVETGGDYLALKSDNVPIAIPASDYDRKDTWVYSGWKYFKYKKGVRTLSSGKTADAIVVVGNLEALGGPERVVNADAADAARNIVLTFWYHPTRGVEAIGVTEHAGAKAAYYCVERPCLFGTEK